MKSYNLFQHRQLASRLCQVQNTGKLGSGPREHSPKHAFSIFHVLLHSIPYKLLIFQCLWTIIVIIIAHFISEAKSTSLSTQYWTSHLVVSSSVSNGIGWALFVLLGFFIREASNRYWQAHLHWTNMTAYLRQIVRHMRQSTYPTTWHHGDHDRIAAHLIAYPIALKMTLRGEREPQQLQDILDKRDLDELLNTQEMHIHCMRVVRAYFSAVEDDAPISFAYAAAEKTPSGNNTRFFFIKFIDAVDQAANAIIRISHFEPAKGYVNHLGIFLYIWLLFLPLALVQISGWFTILWTLVVSYGIGMLFNIAQALNDPFGYDIQDIKLNHLAAESALEILDAHCCDQLDLTSVIRKDHNTPDWLSNQMSYPTKAKEKQTLQIKFRNFFTSLWSFLTDKPMILSLLIYVLWSLFVVFVTWGVSKPNPDAECRWWCVYIPVDKSTISHVSLGISLLLSFWMSDAYRRYWRGIQLWQKDIRTAIEEAALQVALVAKQGSWHGRDRERFFSHLVALSYAAKIQLRRVKVRDTSDLEKILDPQDVAAYREANDIFVHATNVVYGYLNSIDRVHPETTQITKNPFRVSMRGTMKMIWDVEKAIQECEAMVKFPMSPSFTIHLKVFAAFWLALLPLSLVSFNGFFSFLYIIPFGYAIMKVIKIGVEIADPFGCDKDDIPLDNFCEEIKASVHSIYNETLGGTPTLVHESNYTRSMFTPNITSGLIKDTTSDGGKAGINPLSRKPNIALDHHTNPTIMTFVRNFVANFPSVSIWAMIAATMWSVITVCASYALSFLWEDKKRDACSWWCSPIDVEGAALANIGFILFMMLTFRAGDAINRYQDGTMLMINFEKELHHLAVELLVFFKTKLFHDKDKERIIAHIVQIPLCFRDCLLSIVRKDSDEKEGLLSEDDRQHFENSAFPIHHLLQTVQAYVLLQDSLVREGHPDMPEFRVPPPMTYGIMLRIARIRGMIFQAFAVKRFPVVGCYTRHQRIFATFWLMLLPLTMTQFSGFFAILWTPIISYGVLALEEIAIKLVDPYGTDAVDIDVDEMCLHAANSVLEAVDNIKWGCEPNIHPSPVVENPRIGMDVEGKHTNQQYTLAHFEKFETSLEFGNGPALEFTGPIESRMKPKLFAHIIRSVPWWKLIAVIVWTTLATCISFLTKDASKSARWWQSSISLDASVATYISFTAFMLLSFYSQAAFLRYTAAGRVWTHDLRFACSSLAAEFLALFPAGALHEGDHQRVLAHIAALPLVLKHELRYSRDTRELKGLLSHEDMVRIQCANSMSNHCVDVIRSYYAGGTTHKNLFTTKVVLGNRMSYIKMSVAHLENGIASSRFLRSYEIAPGFLVLLNLLLGTWFLLLPFALAEKSGWFTILWVPIIAYGLLGMYSIARELQFPFGNDLNDLDLDEMAKTIVSDVLFVQKHYQHGTDALVHSSETQPYWTNHESPLYGQKQKYSKRNRFGKIYSSLITSLKLAWNTFSPIQFVLLSAWTSLCVVAAWLVGKYFPFGKETEGACGPWFCSRIAIDNSVKEFIGFALFFLLGFRLYDSHWRYVSALDIWEDGILGQTRLLTNRIMESFYGNEWHEGDRERIAGHLAAHAVAVAARLRGEDYKSRFREVLSEEDTNRVLSTRQPSDYCLDVVHRYLTESDWMYGTDKMHPVSKNESRILFFTLAQLRRIALQCENIVRIPLPYGYVQHLRIFLVIWFLLLPLGMVEVTGWLTIFWILFIAYGVTGIEKWAEELSNPFGHDLSDIPMDKMVEQVKEVVRTNLRMYRNGVKDFVRHDRSAFPICEADTNAAVDQHQDGQEDGC